MNKVVVALLLLATPVLTGCLSTGAMYAGNVTNVELSEENYRLVATNVSGEAEAAYLIGFSAGLGPEVASFGLIRIDGTGLLYKEAVEQLWANFESDHGTVTGRALALTNVRYDADALNVLGLYTRPRLSIRADVIEFD